VLLVCSYLGSTRDTTAGKGSEWFIPLAGEGNMGLEGKIANLAWACERENPLTRVAK